MLGSQTAQSPEGGAFDHACVFCRKHFGVRGCAEKTKNRIKQGPQHTVALLGCYSIVSITKPAAYSACQYSCGLPFKPLEWRMAGYWSCNSSELVIAAQTHENK